MNSVDRSPIASPNPTTCRCDNTKAAGEYPLSDNCRTNGSRDETFVSTKKMIYKEIQKKQKQVDPEKFNMRIVEDDLTEVETLQNPLDEERLRKRQTDQQMKLG